MKWWFGSLFEVGSRDLNTRTRLGLWGIVEGTSGVVSAELRRDVPTISKTTEHGKSRFRELLQQNRLMHKSGCSTLRHQMHTVFLLLSPASMLTPNVCTDSENPYLALWCCTQASQLNQPPLH
jgi:hypothetical protein